MFSISVSSPGTSDRTRESLPHSSLPPQTSGLDVDTRTDVYSLGVILYELLMGAVSFDQDSLHRAGPDGMAKIIRESEPEKPSTKLAALRKTPAPDAQIPAAADKLASLRRCDYRTLQRELRGELDWIVLRAIEKDRTRRYATASGLAADIERYLNFEPVSAGPPSTLYRFVKFARRNRGWFVAVSSVSVALVVGFLVAIIGLVQASTANARLKVRIEAQQARDEAQRERNLARTEREEVNRQRINAQLALADGTLAHADALDLAGRWIDAGTKYVDAYTALQQLRKPTLAAEPGPFSRWRFLPTDTRRSPPTPPSTPCGCGTLAGRRSTSVSPRSWARRSRRCNKIRATRRRLRSSAAGTHSEG